MKITCLTCFCAAAIALAAASGCASNRRVPAEPCRSYSMVAGAIGVNNATLANAGVRMGSVVGGKKTDPRQNSNIGNVGLRGALEQSLARFGMLSPTGTYELNATLVEEDVRPGRDGTVSVTETAFYQLRDARSGRAVFQGVFSGGATVSAMDAGGATVSAMDAAPGADAPFSKAFSAAARRFPPWTRRPERCSASPRNAR